MWGTSVANREDLERLAVDMQRAKTFMEIKDLQRFHWAAYELLSQAIYALEASAGLSAPALRDAQDGA